VVHGIRQRQDWPLYDLTEGPDGNLWFTEYGANQIARMPFSTTGTPTTYSITTTANSLPTGITVGPDNNLWFTENGGNKIGRITTAGEISEYTIPTANSQPGAIVAGPDGNLWFTEFGGNKIGRITP